MAEQKTPNSQEEENQEANESRAAQGGGEAPAPAAEVLLTARIAELEAAVDLSRDQLLRKAAEFENYKKRTEGEYASLVKYSNEELIRKLLPVVDDLERSLKAVRSAGNSPEGGGSPESVIAQGVELIAAKFRKILESVGLKPFDVVGKPFDPHLHDALLQIPRTDIPPHTVLEEVERGYMLHDKVIRHAKVIVSGDAVPVGQSGDAPDEEE